MNRRDGRLLGPNIGRKEPFVRNTICSDAKYLRILTSSRRDDAAFNSMRRHTTTLRPILFATLRNVQLTEILHDA